MIKGHKARAFDNYIAFMEHTTKQIKAYGAIKPPIMNILKQQQAMVYLVVKHAQLVIALEE